MKYNILFSIPVHEQPDVAIDQIININHHNENCAIVLHTALGMFNEEKKKAFINKTTFFDNVFVNKVSLDTRNRGILEAHTSNFDYCYNKFFFDYFIPLSSNELFINNNCINYVNKFSYSNDHINSYDALKWLGAKNNVRLDESFNKLKKILKTNTINTHQIEGSFYKRDIFNEISKTIKVLDIKSFVSHELYYPREEVFINAIARHLFPDAPTNKCLTFIDWKSANTFYINPSYLHVSLRKVKKLHKTKQYYSIKRVDRSMDNHLRVYIRKKYTKPTREEIKLFDRYRKHTYLYVFFGEIMYYINKILFSMKYRINRIKSKV